jgi:hypothetical protein
LSCKYYNKKYDEEKKDNVDYCTNKDYIKDENRNSLYFRIPKLEQNCKYFKEK